MANEPCGGGERAPGRRPRRAPRQSTLRVNAARTLPYLVLQTRTVST